MVDTRSTPRTLPALAFARSERSAPLTGVAGGIAERFGLDPVTVRVVFGVLSLGGGFGIALYLLAFIVSRPPGSPVTATRFTPVQGSRQVLAMASITAGILMILRAFGLWFGDSIVWPLTLAAFGALLIYVRGDTPAFAEMAEPGGASGSFTRVGIGGVLVLVGMVLVLGSNISWESAGVILVPVLVSITGLTLIFGPWLTRLAQQLADERRERIRSEERSAMAAHLHDSVLQTLALIQRSDDPKRVAALARAQERELRAWLFQGISDDKQEKLSQAFDRLADRVEATHGVKVETVVVGDRKVDEKLRALVEAAAEAVTNAAKHSGAPTLSVYVEVGDETVEAFVRDGGRGFDLEAIPADRGGINQSIRARMKRWGGTVDLITAPGKGTEVRLRMDR